MGSRVQQVIGAALLVAGFWVGGSSFFIARGFAGAATLAKIGTGLKVAGAALTLSGQRRAAKEALARAREQRARGQTVTSYGGTEGAVTVYGETIVGGTVVEFRTDNDDANDSYDAYVCIAHAFRKGGIDRLMGFYLDDAWIPYPGSWEGGLPGNARGAAHGGVPRGDWSPRDWGRRFSTRAGDGCVAMRFSDGARTGGPPHLVAKFPDWTADDEGLDVVWSEWVLKLRDKSADVFSGGPPNIRAVLRGNRLYDPRKDSTATITAAGGKGAGAHRLDDRSTWEWSDNPALAWTDYAFEYSHLPFATRDPLWAAATDYGVGDLVRTQDSASGSDTWWRARSSHTSAPADRTAAATATAAARLAPARWTELPNHAPRDSTRMEWPSVAAAADRCDGLVPVPGGGTEKRWRCDGALSLRHGRDLHRRNMAALLSSFGGQALRVGDRWHVLAPGPAAADPPTFGASQVGEYQLTTNLPASQRPNTVGGRFHSRDHAWSALDTPARRDAQAVDRDGEIALDVPGDCVTRNTQMQRLAALALERQALQEVFTGLLDWSGLQLQPDSAFMLDLPVFAAPKRFRVDSMTLLHSEAPVSVTAVEDEDDVHDDLPAADYHVVAEDGAVVFAGNAPFAPTAFAARGVNGAIEWSWTPPPLYAEIVLFTAPTASWDDAAETWRGRASEVVVPSPPGETRWGWIRAVGADGRESPRTPNDDVSSVSAQAIGADAPIYEDVAEGGCPSADRGSHGQLWIAPDGRVWQKGDPWNDPVPADVGAEGAHGGLLARFGGGPTPGHSTSATTFVHASGAFDVLTALASFRRLPPSLSSRYVAGLRYRSSDGQWKLDLSADVPATAEATGADLPAAVEEDLVIALRRKAMLVGSVQFPAATTWTRLDDETDDDDPYFWTDNPARTAAFFAPAANIPESEVLFLRPSERCAGDPLNPWFPREGFDVEGGSTTEQAFAVTATPDPPAALAASLDYRASPPAPDDPTAGTAYRTRPGIASALPWGWANQRVVQGAPEQGDDVGVVDWDGWALVEHYGEDGAGFEVIHSLAADDSALPAGQLPPDSLPYDAARNASDQDVGVRIVGGAVSAASSGGRLWHDEEQQASAATPIGVTMIRAVPGLPARGTAPSGDGWGPWRGPYFRRLFAAGDVPTLWVDPTHRWDVRLTSGHPDDQGEYRWGGDANSEAAALAATSLQLAELADIGGNDASGTDHIWPSVRSGDFLGIRPADSDGRREPAWLLVRLTSAPARSAGPDSARWTLSFDAVRWVSPDGVAPRLPGALQIAYPWPYDERPPADLQATISPVADVTEGAAAIRLSANVTGGTSGTGIAYQWQVSPAGGGTLSGSSSSAGSSRYSSLARPWWHPPANVAADTDVTLRLTATRGGETAIATETVKVNDSTKPNPPSNVRFSGVGSSGFTVRWTAGSAVAAVPVIGWQVLVYRGSSSAGTLVSTLAPAATARSVAVTGLDASTGHYVEVRANSSRGLSAAASGSQATTAASSAVTVAIASVRDLDEGSDPVTLSAAVTGGSGEIAYVWSINIGTLSSSTAASPTWTPPDDVGETETAIISLTVTRGSATASDTETVRVRHTGSSSTLSVQIVYTEYAGPPAGASVRAQVLGFANGSIGYAWAADDEVLSGSFLGPWARTSTSNEPVFRLGRSATVSVTVTRGGHSAADVRKVP